LSTPLPIRPRRIAIIGSGVSGIASARVLKRFGHEVIVYERSDRIGGVWAIAYPAVRLQNIAEHYRLSDFPWPFAVDEHPTADQILRYLRAAIDHFGIDVRPRHEIAAMEELPDGWQCEIVTPRGTVLERFDHVIVATGQYSGEQSDLGIPGRDRFTGQVLTERQIPDLSIFDGKTVAVVGFGKTALDLATFAVERGAAVHHVFRSPRWLIPRILFGSRMNLAVAKRVAAFMMPAWVHSNPFEAVIHRWFGFLVAGYWRGTEGAIRLATGLHPFHPKDVRARMRELEPDRPLTYQIRAAGIPPDDYHRMVLAGRIIPHRGAVTAYAERGLLLDGGKEVPADIVVLAIGHKQPRFPYLPQSYRDLLASEPDGVQLYRHLIHPRIPRLAFAGFNHSFLHISCVEVSMIWYAAAIAGDLALPPPDEMEASAARVSQWKRDNTLFELTRSYGLATRFHNYIDVLLRDLGVRHRRKASRFAESTETYYPADYAGVFDEYQAVRATRPLPAPVTAFDT
jgi:dimethylaniline monooxygenase (N-oxide forming)